MVKTTAHPLPASVLHAGRRSNDPLRVPRLSARPGGPAERVARFLERLHPALVFVLLMLLGLAAIALVSICLGFLITRVVEPSWGIGASDERMNVWLATHRTGSRTEASLIGSIIAGGVVLPIVAGSLAIVFAALRRWRVAAFFAFALAVESATYRATTLAVHSHRPRVARLESLPVNASYPSGHTAASLAVYGGIVLLLTSRISSTTLRSFAWLLALSIVAFVALSRMYRGMHHSLDVAGGVFVGVAALTVIVFACRAAGAAADLRDDGHARAEGRS